MHEVFVEKKEEDTNDRKNHIEDDSKTSKLIRDEIEKQIVKQGSNEL